MTDPFNNLDTARARIRAELDGARQRNAAITELAEQIETTTATARSSRGEVTVTATPAATITNVTIASAALDLTADALGRLVTETIAAAQRAAAQLAIAAAADTLGPASQIVTTLQAETDSRYGDIRGETHLR